MPVYIKVKTPEGKDSGSDSEPEVASFLYKNNSLAFVLIHSILLITE